MKGLVIVSSGVHKNMFLIAVCPSKASPGIFSCDILICNYWYNNTYIFKSTPRYFKPWVLVRLLLKSYDKPWFNLFSNHFVMNLTNFLSVHLRARPQYESSSFVLMTTFPNKELQDETQTLEQAKLLNAVIVQKPK